MVTGIDTARQGNRAQASDPDVARAWTVLADVPDPEIPVLSVLDLGIVRDVRCLDGALAVDVTPTYTGCPATEVIERSIRERLLAAGFDEVGFLRRQLSPPWTTDWISDAGRDKLRAFGIAPPAGSAALAGRRDPALPVACPHCKSQATAEVSEFGSTPCKAAWRCEDCLEPFELFKCL
ncbi:MAG: 1,2-phenylacetyl-CoA epoxidase subunit PaaD [Woeseiaceae bacterium]|nr:1,2-phenylacetyl-CoA epoxidase subunit PaaD [Woeseiaceae bacterium]